MKATHPAVRDALATYGKMTSAELAELFTDSTQRDIAGILGKMRRAKTKLVFIKEWTRHGDGPRDTPRPVYALGNKLDAKRPAALPNKVITRRYRERKRVAPPTVPNSIFQLGARLTTSCPHCNHIGHKVIETRHGSNGTRRRVRCAGCGRTYAVYANGAALSSATSSTLRALAGLPR